MTLPLSLLLAALLTGQAAPQAPGQPPKPAAPAKPRPPAPVRTTLSMTVTDGAGAPLAEVAVRGSGPVDREAATDVSGMVRLEALTSGVYRFRFTRDGYVTLERDVTVPAGQRAMEQYVMLSTADKPEPPPPPPPEPEPPKTPVLPPPGKPVNLSVTEFVERNFIAATEPQKITRVACSGLQQTVLLQIREPWDKRQHPGSDAVLYVIGGEGTLNMDGRDIALRAGAFVSVPRGTIYGLTRRGRNPLIVLATLAGEPCM